MTKKLMCAFALVCGAMVAQADFLWWQVDPVSGREFSLADLYVTDGTRSTALESVQPADADPTTGLGTKVETVSTDVSGYTSSQYSFFVELVTYSDANYTTVTGTQKLDAVSYDSLVTAGYITGASQGPGLPSAPAPSGGYNLGGGDVPEPTSGMLFLLGGALMALRRRRRA